MMAVLPPDLREKALKRLAEDKVYNKNSTSYMGKDSREGRLNTIKTHKGEFTFKSNRMGED